MFISHLQLVTRRLPLVGCLLLLLAGQASLANDLSSQEQRGKAIYRKGAGRAYLGNAELELPGSNFPCANCHGPRGAGGQEGGSQPPPLTWAALKARAYTEATLARAIQRGLDPAGRKLQPGMPQYRLTAAQMAALLAYLKKLGTTADPEPGVTETTIKLGAALALSGPQAWLGAEVKAVLTAYLAEVNAGGGVFGRRLELVTADSRGTPAGALAAVTQLVEETEVLALLAGTEAQEQGGVPGYLARAETPLVGPLTFAPRLPAVPNRFIFHLLPGLAAQARSLLDFVGPTERVALLYQDGLFDADDLPDLPALLHTRAYRVSELPEALAVLAAQRPAYLLFFGGAAEFAAVARAVAVWDWQPGLLSSAALLGSAAFAAPPALAARTYLASAVSFAQPERLAEFNATARQAGARNAAVAAVAYAAAKTLVEGLKRSGRLVSRTALIQTLEALRDFPTGVLPPLSFGPNRRVGVDKALIVGIEPLQQRYVEARAPAAPKP